MESRAGSTRRVARGSSPREAGLDRVIAGLTLAGAGHPVPPDPILAPVGSRDAVLRTARWMAPRPSAAAGPGTVLICTGRSEFLEKYLEVVGELRSRGFAVVIFDWRGQGLSSRPLRNALKGHVWGFRDYEGDLAAVAEQVLEPFCPRPWYGLAHSMGGAVALNAAADRPGLFHRLVLSAPMVEIARLPWRAALPTVARVLRYGGLGRSFIPGRRGREVMLRGFEGNDLTSDPARYARMLDYLSAEPRLNLGAPTIGWLHAAFEAMARLRRPDLPRRLTTPVLAVLPGEDRVVVSRATERLLARLRASRTVAVPGSRHEVLMERDPYRQQFWAAFDAFVPASD